MTSFRRLLSLVFVLLVQPVAAQVCHICGEPGGNLMQYPNIVLANDPLGRTCSDVSIQVALMNYLPGSADCNRESAVFFDRCCRPGFRPAGVDRASAGLPPQSIPPVTPIPGGHPVCEVCRDGDFPYATWMVINFLYMGAADCREYWRMGQAGQIEPHMCHPVQFFSYEPCGCGEFNPYYNLNHPLAQQAQQAPDTGGATNGRTNGDANGATNGDTSGGLPTQRPVDNDDKDGVKMGGSYGGAGGVFHGGRRGLKGAKTAPNADVLVTIEV